MSGLIDALLGSFGFPALSLERLETESKQRLLLISILPILALAALAADIGVIVMIDDFYGPSLSESWRRIFLIAQVGVAALPPVSIGVLVAAGIRKWRPDEGAWLLLAGALLVAVALGLGLASAFIYAVMDFETAFTDAHADTWTFVSRQMAFISVGYFFLAYRARPGGGRIRYRRRRRRYRM